MLGPTTGLWYLSNVVIYNFSNTKEGLQVKQRDVIAINILGLIKISSLSKTKRMGKDYNYSFVS